MKYLKDSAGRKFIYTEALLNRGGFEAFDVDEKPKPKRSRRKKSEPEPKPEFESPPELEGWEE